jgi:hypothetical protein
MDIGFAKRKEEIEVLPRVKSLVKNKYKLCQDRKV